MTLRTDAVWWMDVTSVLGASGAPRVPIMLCPLASALATLHQGLLVSRTFLAPLNHKDALWNSLWTFATSIQLDSRVSPEKVNNPFLLIQQRNLPFIYHMGSGTALTLKEGN